MKKQESGGLHDCLVHNPRKAPGTNNCGRCYKPPLTSSPTPLWCFTGGASPHREVPANYPQCRGAPTNYPT